MPHIFTYRDDEIYSHHTLDEHPIAENFQMHAHEWMEIFYLLSGKCSYLVEGSKYELHPGDILIMRAAETHMLEVKEDEPYERIAIHFSPAILAAVPKKERFLRPFLDRPLGQRNLYRVGEAGDKRMKAAFEEFCFEGIGDVKLNLVSRLLMFLTVLSAVFERQIEMDGNEDSFQSQLVAYVNEHMFEDISLQSIADAFFRSRSQISRVFRQSTGSPLWEYVTIKRLLAAQAMLQRGVNASEACLACGFSDYSSFFRAYRARFGHSPKNDYGKELKEH